MGEGRSKGAWRPLRYCLLVHLSWVSVLRLPSRASSRWASMLRLAPMLSIVNVMVLLKAFSFWFAAQHYICL